MLHYLPEIVVLVLSNLSEEHLVHAHKVCHLWRSCVEDVRAARRREVITFSVTGSETIAFYGHDLVQGPSGVVMKYRAEKNASRITLSPWFKLDRNASVLVNGVPTPVLHCFDQYVVCSEIALELSPNNDYTSDVSAIYRPTRRTVPAPIRQLWEKTHWGSRAPGALQLYMNTTDIRPLIDVMLNFLLEEVQACYNEIEVDRKCIVILTRMKRADRIPDVLRRINQKVDSAFAQTIAELHIYLLDLAYRPKDKVLAALKREFLARMESVYTIS